MESLWIRVVIIKIHIAKTRACAFQVKLDSGVNGGTATFIIFVGTHAEISLCQMTPESTGYYSSLFNVNITLYKRVLCLMLIVFNPASRRLQMALILPRPIGFWRFYAINHWIFCKGLLRESEYEQSSSRSQGTFVTSFIGVGGRRTPQSRQVYRKRGNVSCPVISKIWFIDLHMIEFP